MLLSDERSANSALGLTVGGVGGEGGGQPCIYLFMKIGLVCY